MEEKNEFAFWAKSDEPIIKAAEIFCIEDLEQLLNAIFSAGLFLIKIHEHRDDFTRCWQVLYGNEQAKDLMLAAEQMTLDVTSTNSGYKKKEPGEETPKSVVGGLK